jgi:hypothetical protein
MSSVWQCLVVSVLFVSESNSVGILLAKISMAKMI